MLTASRPSAVSVAVAEEKKVDEKKDAAGPGAGGETRLFEMRTYYAAPGKMDALLARFRNHTIRLFEKHGMHLVGFWVPADAKGAQEKLVYILAHKDKASAEAGFKAFRADPEWIKAKDESEKDGKIVEKVESVFLSPVDFSPIK
jgi:hypothetical protein